MSNDWVHNIDPVERVMGFDTLKYCLLLLSILYYDEKGSMRVAMLESKLVENLEN